MVRVFDKEICKCVEDETVARWVRDAEHAEYPTSTLLCQTLRGFLKEAGKWPFGCTGVVSRKRDVLGPILNTVRYRGSGNNRGRIPKVRTSSNVRGRSSGR